MPHQIIEYSENVRSRVNIDELIRVMHEAAASIEAFPLAGIRTRACCRDEYRIADSHADNAFVSVTVRIGQGRSLEVRKQACDSLFATLSEFLEPAFAGGPLAISFEMQEIDPEMRINRNNLRSYIAERGGQSS